MTSEVTLVVPCYNEAERLDQGAFVDLARDSQVGIVFVDDGSRDATRDILAALCEADRERFSLIVLEKNMGKAEAVRRGLLHALSAGARMVGYFDADLSTPPREIRRLVDLLRRSPDLDVIIGARIMRLGARIQRDVTRHYLGRVFASAASLVLLQRVYDTQCGAKLFRSTEALRDALAQPFLSPWAFDVELLGRLSWGSEHASPVPNEAFLEVPLEEWRDVAGSKLRLGSMLKAGTDLLRIRRALDRRRRRGRR